MSEEAGIFWSAFGGGIAGGVMSLIAVMVVEWAKWYFDRPMLKASSSFGFAILPFLPGSQDEILFILEFTNPHSKPQTITGFGVDYRVKPNIHIWRLRIGGKLMRGILLPNPGYPIPDQLAYGRSYSHFMTLSGFLSFCHKFEQDPALIESVWVKTGTNSVFKSKIPSGIRDFLTKEYDKRYQRTRMTNT